LIGPDQRNNDFGWRRAEGFTNCRGSKLPDLGKGLVKKEKGKELEKKKERRGFASGGPGKPELGSCDPRRGEGEPLLN